MSSETLGPKFRLEASKAFVVLGHSERKRVGEFLAQSLDERRFFQNIWEEVEDVEVITLNRSAAMINRAALAKEMRRRAVIAHSAGIMRIRGALQVIAFNPPEQVPFIELLKRANDIMADHIEKESGAHKGGILDMIGAGVELARSPLTTLVTPLRISRGYSTVDDLVGRYDDFPAGRAIVHSGRDSFRFQESADMQKAADDGISTVVIAEHYHMEALLAPNRTIDAITPFIFPEPKV